MLRVVICDMTLRIWCLVLLCIATSSQLYVNATLVTRFLTSRQKTKCCICLSVCLSLHLVNRIELCCVWKQNNSCLKRRPIEVGLHCRPLTNCSRFVCVVCVWVVVWKRSENTSSRRAVYAWFSFGAQLCSCSLHTSSNKYGNKEDKFWPLGWTKLFKCKNPNVKHKQNHLTKQKL